MRYVLYFYVAHLFFIMKTIFLIFTLLTTLSLSAQNLVPNYSFDSILTCHYADLINSPSQIQKVISPWFSAVSGNSSPDVYNICSDYKQFGVPFNNYSAYQMPFNGNGYTGIITYNDVFVREYLETPLLKTLTKNVHYFVQFYVSPKNDLPEFGWRMTYSDAIGLTFTDTALVRYNSLIIIEPSINNRKGKLIKDTVGWTSISGCYKAKGGERFATIGNFRTNAETLIEYEDLTKINKQAYHYIDDVSVLEFNPLPDSTVLVCAGEAQKYNAAFLNGTYKWNTGSTDSIISINKSGIYSVEVTVDGCVLTDTIVVIVPPDAQKKLPILRGDTTLCDGKKLELSATAVPGQYTWSTGANTPTITVSKTNKYAVTVTNRCGTYDDDVDITFKHCACNVYVPNAFSPNNDGVNDELQVYFGCDFNYKVKRFQVFNRWGSPVFSAHDVNDIRWNGQLNGQQLQMGVYVWYLEYAVEIDGKMKNVIESGDFTIVL
jgi:gliding motility-associated-like protein